MKYKIIECLDQSVLEAEVNAAMLKGWKPYGGLAIAQSEIYPDGSRCVETLYAQAMVKEN